MKIRRILIVLSILALSVMFCSAADFGITDEMMATLTAQVPALQTEMAYQLTQVALTPVVASPAGLGSISGTLSYPADSLPAMRVVAYNTTNIGQYYYIDTPLGQGTYQIPNVPAGTYYVVSYSLGGGAFPVGLASGYTAAVPCGLTEACTDHSLLPVAVETGNETSGIRPADSYGGTFPPMPGPAPVQQPTQPQPTQANQGSAISGSLSYPSEFIPPLTVVAFKVSNMSEYYFVKTAQNQSTYELPLPGGSYYVVAYVQGGNFAGGYTQAVPCGLDVSCTDHSLIPIDAPTGAATANINPTDWYAPDGTFPPNPVP